MRSRSAHRVDHLRWAGPVDGSGCGVCVEGEVDIFGSGAPMILLECSGWDHESVELGKVLMSTVRTMSQR